MTSEQTQQEQLERVEIFRQIAIKQIVTAESKEAALTQLQAEMEKVGEEQKAFEADKTKLLTEASLKGADQAQLARFRQHFETDGAHFQVRQDELHQQIEAVKNMELGEEVAIGSVEGPYQLQVGQALEDALKAEIVLKDGVVVEIRG